MGRVLSWGVVAVAVVGAVLWTAGVRLPHERVRDARPVAKAEPLDCDATWVGARRGDWRRPANWSTGRRPGRSTQACIPPGTTVAITRGRNLVWAVEGGSLDLRGGALLLMGTAVASEVADLRLVEATLGGPGKLIVTRHMFLGPAGKMQGAGSVDLGPASNNLIAAGVGRRSAVIGGDDGTGPAVVDSDDVPGPLCSRYSPPWAEDCATRHPREERAVRRAWADFAAAANRGARAALVSRLAPRSCRLETEGRSGDCDRVAAGVLDEVARSGPLTPALGRVLVEGDEAVGTPRHPNGVRFARVGGAWRVSVL